MPNQHSKKRRKKYEPGSAYAGHVRPTGILGFMSSGTMIKFIFIGMAVALAIGGGSVIFSGNLFSTSATHTSFVEPGNNDNEGTPTPGLVSYQPTQYGAAPEITIDPTASVTATILTDAGAISVELLPGQALETVNNFVFLAENGFYDGLSFHFVSPGFSAQTGDPYCRSDAPVGACPSREGGPGYDLTESVDGDFSAGTLGMVNGSQFFIAMQESGQFDDSTPFGQVTSGLEIADLLTEETRIESIEISIQ